MRKNQAPFSNRNNKLLNIVSFLIGLAAAIWFEFFRPKSSVIKLILGLIAIACLTYSATVIVMEVIDMKNYFWVIVLIGGLVGSTAAGFGYKQYEGEHKQLIIAAESNEDQSRKITQSDSSKEKVAKDMPVDLPKSHQLKPQEVSENVHTKTPNANNQSTAIDLEGGSGEFESNLIEGFQIGIHGKNSAISGKENVIRREQNNTFPPPTGEFKQLSNNDLSDYVKRFADTMRMFGQKYEEKKLQNLQDKKIRDEEKYDFKTNYLPTAISLASETMKRLGVVNISNTQNATSINQGGKVLINGMLVGPYPVSAAADFLEYVAEELKQTKN